MAHRPITAWALAAAMLLAVVSSVLASERLSDEWGRGLNLTAAQVTQVRRVLQEARREADGVEAEGRLSPAQKQVRFAEIEQRVDRRLYALLTPAQQRKMRALHPEVARRLDAALAPGSTVGSGLGDTLASRPHPSSRPAPVHARPDAPATVEDPVDITRLDVDEQTATRRLPQGEVQMASTPPSRRERQVWAREPRRAEGRRGGYARAARSTFVLPLPTFNVRVRMGGQTVPLPISLPSLRFRL